MSCYNPNLAVLTTLPDGSRPRPKIIGSTRDLYFSEEVRQYRLSKFLQSDCDELITLPCGNCLGCRLDKSLDWATRLTLEKKSHPDETCWFVTLTYNDDHILKSPYGVPTVPERKLFCDKFFKDFRSAYEFQGGAKIKYFVAAEYGDLYSRPHLHFVVYGFDPRICDKYKFQLHNPAEQIYTSEFIEKFWPYGFVSVQPLSYRLNAYIARYVTKKLRQDSPEYKERIREWQSQSQELGLDYFNKHYKEIYKADGLPLFTGESSRMVPVPRYFDKKMEQIDPEFYREVKQRRKERSDMALELKIARSKGLTLPEILRNEEEAKAQAILSLCRNYEKGLDVIE